MDDLPFDVASIRGLLAGCSEAFDVVVIVALLGNFTGAVARGRREHCA